MFLNWPPTGSECHCITGVNTAVCVERKYKSLEGNAPAKPAISNPQKGTPDKEAESPALIIFLNSSHVDF